MRRSDGGDDADGTDRERAALEWTDAVTRVADSHVPDDVYERVQRLFTADELVSLTYAIVAINGWNRIAIALRMPRAKISGL